MITPEQEEEIRECYNLNLSEKKKVATWLWNILIQNPHFCNTSKDIREFRRGYILGKGLKE